MEAEWVQFATFLGSVIVMFFSVVGLFVWNRTESRNDMRHILSLITSIQEEIKDFHGRLCALEEKNKK